MTSRIDLHIHTSASDGKFSPEDIVRRSAELGLTVIALCDHDSVDGITAALEAARGFPQIRVIPSVEISTYVPGSEAHLLGYFIDYTDPELKTTLASLRSSRRERAQKMIAKLGNFGVHIEWQRVQEIAGSGSIGRPHIAQAMIAKLKTAGLVGLEVNYNSYTEDERASLAQLAKKYDLIATGGSDYHGLDDSVETMLGGTYVPEESAEQLIALAQSRVLKPASS